jgi:hypothetical protein
VRYWRKDIDISRVAERPSCPCASSIDISLSLSLSFSLSRSLFLSISLRVCLIEECTSASVHPRRTHSRARLMYERTHERARRSFRILFIRTFISEINSPLLPSVSGVFLPADFRLIVCRLAFPSR